MPGTTSDKTTRVDFLHSIEKQDGKANRTWVRDCGMPTAETLQARRAADPPVHYRVGTPRGRLTPLEKAFLAKHWEQARESVQVNLLARENDLSGLARSAGRVDTERAMRRRRLKPLWKRLQELPKQRPRRDDLLMKIGAAKNAAGRTVGRVDIQLPEEGQAVTPATVQVSLRKTKLRQARRRAGGYLWRSHLTETSPAPRWQDDLHLTEVEPAFQELQHDRGLRPLYHPLDPRIAAPLVVAFLAYGLQVPLQNPARSLAPGLTVRAMLDKLSALQRGAVPLPTPDGRQFVLPRYTPPEADQRLLLQQLKLTLPEQPPPRIQANPLPAHPTAANSL